MLSPALTVSEPHIIYLTAHLTYHEVFDRNLKTEIMIAPLHPDFSRISPHISKFPMIHPVTEDKNQRVILESSFFHPSVQYTEDSPVNWVTERDFGFIQFLPSDCSPLHSNHQHPFSSGLLQWRRIWCFAVIAAHPSKMGS